VLQQIREKKTEKLAISTSIPSLFMEITEPIYPTIQPERNKQELLNIAEQAYFGYKSSNTKHQQHNNHTLDERNPAPVSKP